MILKFKDIRVQAQDVVLDEQHEILVFARMLASPEEARAIAYYVQKGGFVDTEPYAGFTRTAPASHTRLSATNLPVQGVAAKLVTLYVPRLDDLYFVAAGERVAQDFRRFLHAHTPYPVPPDIHPNLTHAVELEVHAREKVLAWRLSDQNIRDILQEATI